jgi:hypothetical protein
VQELDKVAFIVRKAGNAATWITVALCAVFLLYLLAPGLVASGQHGAESAMQAGMDNKAIPDAYSLSSVKSRILGKAVFRTMRVRKAQVVDELSHFILKGVSVRGEVAKAYVYDTKLKQLRVKSVGDAIGSWEISDIRQEGIEVRRGNEILVLPKG